VHVFHDERGFTSDTRYGVHGMLAVPDDLVEEFGREIRRLRAKQGYFHEMHFKDLATRTPDASPDWLLARDCLRFLFEFGFESARFKAFAVDFKHSEFDRVRYHTRTKAYRRFAVTNAKSLVAWCLRGDGKLLVTPFTDAGNPHARAFRRRDGTLFDSFGRYVERECRIARTQEGKTFYPDVEFSSPLRAIPSNPSMLSEQLASELGLSMDELITRSDLIQLTDLLVGSLGAALAPDASNVGKQQLIELVASHLAETYELPLSKAIKRARRFSLSCFPGTGRTPYAVSLAGVREFGVELLRTNHDLRQLRFPTTGERLDAVHITSGIGRSPS